MRKELIMREYQVKVVYNSEKSMNIRAKSLEEAKKIALTQSKDVKDFKKDIICTKMSVLSQKV